MVSHFNNFFVPRGWRKFVWVDGKFYLDLVKVFYANVHRDEGVVKSRIKGIDVILDDKIWINVANLILVVRKSLLVLKILTSLLFINLV